MQFEAYVYAVTSLESSQQCCRWERKKRDMNGNLFGETVILRQIAFAVFRNFGPAAWQDLPDRQKTKKVTKNLITFFCSFRGKGGIRTPGASQHGGFQDRCNRPLYHLSKLLCKKALFSKAMQRYGFFLNLQTFRLFFFEKSAFFCL